MGVCTLTRGSLVYFSIGMSPKGKSAIQTSARHLSEVVDPLDVWMAGIAQTYPTLRAGGLDSWHRDSMCSFVLRELRIYQIHEVYIFGVFDQNEPLRMHSLAPSVMESWEEVSVVKVSTAFLTKRNR